MSGAMSQPAADTMAVADRLVALCREGQFKEAVEELYADDAVQIEAVDMPPESPMQRVTEGKAALLKSHDEFDRNVEVHGCEVGDPFPHGDRFICSMTLDATYNQGPMAGQRSKNAEMCLYTVENGKITRGEFFYAM